MRLVTCFERLGRSHFLTSRCASRETCTGSLQSDNDQRYSGLPSSMLLRVPHAATQMEVGSIDSTLIGISGNVVWYTATFEISLFIPPLTFVRFRRAHKKVRIVDLSNLVLFLIVASSSFQPLQRERSSAE